VEEESMRAARPLGEVFLSYAHKDVKWRDDLLTMLAPALRRRPMDLWYDGKIKPSQDWRGEIEAALRRARVGVLLVSKHFLASDFINNNELPFLIAAAEQARVKLSWVLIGDAMHEDEQFAKLQALHDIAKPLSALRGNARNAALKKIAQGIVNLAR
jgi:internalin A